MVNQNHGLISESRNWGDSLDTIIKVLNDKEGKDKTLKLIQYTGKLIIWAGGRSSIQPTFDYYQIAKPINPLISQLSSFRKVIRLGNWLKGARSISKGGLKNADWVEFIDLYNEVCDDLYLLAKIGTILFNDEKSNKRWTYIFDREANRAWFLAILINLYSEYKKLVIIQKVKEAENVEAKEKSLSVNRIYDARWMSSINIAKSLCDLIFCSVDVFEIEVDSSIQIISGLSSGIIGYYKIYKKML